MIIYEIFKSEWWWLGINCKEILEQLFPKVKIILNIQTAQIIQVVLYVNHVCGDFNVLYTASISTLIFFYLCLHYHIGLFHYLKKYTVIVKPPPFKLKTPHSPQKDKISTITGFKSCPSNH